MSYKIRTYYKSDYHFCFRGRVINPFTLTKKELNFFKENLVNFYYEKSAVLTKKLISGKDQDSQVIESFERELKNVKVMLDKLEKLIKAFSEVVIMSRKKDGTERRFQSINDIEEIDLALKQGYEFNDKINRGYFIQKKYKSYVEVE